MMSEINLKTHLLNIKENILISWLPFINVDKSNLSYFNINNKTYNTYTVYSI